MLKYLWSCVACVVLVTENDSLLTQCLFAEQHLTMNDKNYYHSSVCVSSAIPISEVPSVEVWDWVSDFGTELGSDLSTSSCMPSPSGVSMSFCTSSLAYR